MRYIIYGAGAVGGVIGAKLHLAGHDVVLIARGAHLDAIRERGLALETPDGTQVLPMNAVAQPSEIEWRPGDLAVMTMKTQHTEAALGDLLASAGPGVPVVCAQNAVENERMALRRFPHVYAMMVLLPATYLTPGVVQASCWPASGVLDLGCYPAGSDHLSMRIAADLTAAGFASDSVDDAMRWKYAKLLSNLGNALQAASSGDTRTIHARMREEAIACYQAAGIAWASEDEMAERRKGMSPMRSVGRSMRGGGSTWQSVARGAGSVETDYLNGEIVLLGRLHDVPTPANAAMQSIARRMLNEHAAPGALSLSDVEDEIARQASGEN
jgi:2-dehydropantoate 2-reductase